MDFELTIENARRFYAQPNNVLESSMRPVLARFRDPQTDAHWIDAYLAPLNDKFTKRTIRLGRCGGLSKFMLACVELGLPETLVDLAQRPRSDVETIVVTALDTLVELINLSKPSTRPALLTRAAECNALRICLNIMETYELCLDRYTAVRAVHALAIELTWGPLLNPMEAGEVIERLARYAVEGVTTFSDELRNPDRVWQVSRMIDRRVSSPDIASEYGKRWSGLTQELCLFSAHALVCVEPRHTRQYLREVVQSHPTIVDHLLDCASMPRSEAYPDNSAPETALEVLVLLVSWPKHVVPGVDTPFEREIYFDCTGLKGRVESERDASLASLEVLVSRVGWRDKLLLIWKRLDDEQWGHMNRMLDHVVSRAWGGMSIDSETSIQIYSSRGHLRILALRLITAVTYLPSIASHDLVSFFRIAYLATKRGNVLAADISSYRPRGRQDLHEYTERIAAISRTPLSAAHLEVSNRPADPQCSVLELAITGPTALLRLLTVCAERGLLQQMPTWTALPEGCASSLDLAQVQQIASPPVVSKLLPLIFKRVVAQRENCRGNVDREPLIARADYCLVAELAAALVSFDGAVQGRWRQLTRGAWKELVLSLGNAAELSARALDYDTAFSLIIAAVGVSDRIASDVEGVTQQVKEKNVRRWRTARENLQRRQQEYSQI